MSGGDPGGGGRPAAAASEEEGGELHLLVAAAGREDRFPPWARCAEGRREHALRVAELMTAWAEELELPPEDRVRWRAAAVLHDALRDARPEELRPWTDLDWPEPVLHAPACAGRLGREGVEDEELLRAIAYHPVGHPEFARPARPADPGPYLYMADFLEPGREFLEEPRTRIRLLLPEQREEGLRSVVALRIAHRLEVRGGIRPETVELWNRVVGRPRSGGGGG